MGAGGGFVITTDGCGRVSVGSAKASWTGPRACTSTPSLGVGSGGGWSPEPRAASKTAEPRVAVNTVQIRVCIGLRLLTDGPDKIGPLRFLLTPGTSRATKPAQEKDCKSRARPEESDHTPQSLPGSAFSRASLTFAPFSAHIEKTPGRRGSPTTSATIS